MKDQKGDKSVEITVLVELFSTFFEKITFVHPDKDILIKNLAKFKHFLYGNQQNLEKGYEFLQAMKEQYQQYLNENGSKQRSSIGIPQMQGYINNIISEQQPSISSQLELTSPPPSQQQQQQQTFQQYQQMHNNSNNNSQQRKSDNGQKQQQQQQSNSNQPLINTNNIQNKKQQQQQIFTLELSNLNENANLFKIQSIQDFTGIRSEGINPQIALNGSGYTHIREFISEVNAFYRCIGFRYLESLIKNNNISKLQDLLKSVQSQKVQLDSYYNEESNGNDQNENNNNNNNNDGINRENNKDLLRSTFCGYISYIIESLLLLPQNNNNKSNNQNNQKDNQRQTIINNPSDLQELLYKIVNGDSVFDQALISYVKEQTVRFIQESDPLYITFLLQNQELKNEKELIQHIRSQNDPLEIAMKIVASGMETQINIYTIDNDNKLTQKILKFNSLPESSKNSIDLLKIKLPYIIYYLIYNQIEGHSLARSSSMLIIGQQNQQEQQQFNLQQNDSYTSISQNNQKNVNKQQQNIPIVKQSMNSTKNISEQSNSRSSQQIEDLKQRGGYLQKLIEIFDENTDDLINKISNYKDGYNPNNNNNNIDYNEDDNEYEQDEQEEDNIQKVLKEQQINSTKQQQQYRVLNFYSNIQNQDKPFIWGGNNANGNGGIHDEQTSKF